MLGLCHAPLQRRQRCSPPLAAAGDNLGDKEALVKGDVGSPAAQIGTPVPASSGGKVRGRGLSKLREQREGGMMLQRA